MTDVGKDRSIGNGLLGLLLPKTRGVSEIAVTLHPIEMNGRMLEIQYFE